MTGHGFRVSSFCHLSGCVAVARDGDVVLVRHSGWPGAVLRFSVEEWAAFLLGVKDGEFDQLIPEPESDKTKTTLIINKPATGPIEITTVVTPEPETRGDR